MELTSSTVIKELLAKHQARPSKTMGQNFLIDNRALEKIIEAANITNQDTILEIGPGIGTLTKELAKKAKKVIAIEKDRTMMAILQETLKDFNNVEVINENALDYNVQLKNYKVVANIPYYITSPLIRKFLESNSQPKKIVLMIQKEVAQRICAKPPHMSILAVSVQFYANPNIISYVPKGCFWPAPNVDSAIISIVPFAKNETVSTEKFFEIVKAGFLHPRKQLGNNFSAALKKDRTRIDSWLLKNGIEPSRRAETLSIQNWIELTVDYSVK